MGKKDGELWDDSALIDAFEDAISSYKVSIGLNFHGFLVIVVFLRIVVSRVLEF